MGGSYGGYATLVGLTFTPDVFACGVDIVGPSDLETTARNHRRPTGRRSSSRNTSASAIRAPRRAAQFLKSRSPLHKVDKITEPAADRPGRQRPARASSPKAIRSSKAMTGKDIPVTYVVFPDEGHGFARPENSLAFNAVTEAFLAGISAAAPSRWATISRGRAMRSGRATTS